MTSSTKASETIFVRLPNWVGDVCMSLPSLALLSQTGRPVIVCARPWAQELLSGHTELHGFIPMSSKLWQDRAAVSQARAHQAARGLLLPDSLSSALAFRLAGLPCAGYRDDGRSLLLRWPMNKPTQSLHAVQSWHHLTMNTLAQWQLPIHNREVPQELGLHTTEAQKQQAQAALVSVGLADQPFVLIAPTATGLHKGRIKVWSGFRELTSLLQAQGVKVAMCPPPSETGQARAAVPEAVCLPPLPLGAFATLTGMAALVVCNDSGVSHLAAAVNAPQLTLFGVTSPSRTGPWSPNAQCLGEMDAWPTVQTVFSQVMAQLGKAH
ncbi:heptosyltransferase [Pusillimonas sp. CC-YST705]|uniref:Heptosyltransferase n=1 Tax=Mesopusillimonas faecipullorum TaxID=2755040 RepID=A0ABS8CFL9_9BURK|nr:glycosyltransferase family 9 protein [Mesopusillimonas faecipullorum]MCB5364833.1 heptosyltransferase [Mesopusillimonas faecipullorum]